MSGISMLISNDVPMPKTITGVQPVYPPLARAARKEGTVVVRIRIGEDGAVTDAQVVESVPLLDRAALDAVRQWTFAPTVVGGRAVASVIDVTLDFVLPRAR
jgi:protein TonB